MIGTPISCASDESEAALMMVLGLSKAQFFYDGNKRSALMLANHYLANVGAGCAVVVEESMRDKYLDILIDFYHGRLSLDDAAWDLGELAMVYANTNVSRTLKL